MTVPSPSRSGTATDRMPGARELAESLYSLLSRDIEIRGADISGESWDFSVGDNGASLVGDMMWFGPLAKFQKLFFHTPLVNVFIFGSEAYHDYFRWPLRDRRTFESWLTATPWGKLFQQYPSVSPGGAQTKAA